MSRLTSKRVLWVIACFVAFLQPPCLCFGSAQECPSNCSCDESKGIATCAGTISVNELNRLPSWAKKIKFSPAPDLCDDVFKQIIDFAHSAGIELMGIPLDCGETKSRKRRDVAGSEPGAPNTTAPSGPDGLPVFPCDFEQGFCQWFQSSDSDFQWTRHKGSTASLDTGPSSDHTTVNGTGWYIYIETSDPNREGNKARLVSPTLRPVDPRNPCNATFFTHMYGDAIGQLNIVQAPVIGHDVTKLSITSQLGNMWVMKQVVFDSSREFQIVLEGVRGSSYRGDIALDDITFSEGCQRLEPGYIRLDDGDTFNAGEVTVYYNGSWGRVCSDHWTQATADVVCRELGFVNASKSTNNGTDTTGKTAGFESLICSGGQNAVSACASSGWSDELRCTANKTAAVVCQGVTPVCPAKNHVLCPNPARNATLAKCISHGQLCDFVDDCGDGWDETGCANYTKCTFEDPGLCGWIQAQNDEMEWTRNRGSTPTGYTGPGSDHTGNSSRYYIYVEVSERSSEKASLAVTPRFQGNHEGLCRVRFFYHMYGWDTGQLRVLLVDWFSTRTVWEKRGSQGQIWKRAEVTLLNTTRSFRVIFEAEHTGNSAMGDIALDDVSFTPECRPAAFENVSCTPESYKCRSGECISLDLLCDFNKDCLDGSDEENCGVQDPGRCNFEASFCDWKNLTDDDFDFSRRNSPTPSWGTGPESDHTLGYGQRGYYIYIESSSPRVMNDKARLASPQFMWKGVTGCKMSFFYHMWSEASYSYMGTLKLLMKNAITSQTVVLWQRSGSQGNKWLRAIVPVNTTWTVTQIVFEAIRGSTYRGDIALDDVSFSPQCYPSEAVHLDKNYDVRLAGAKASYQGRVEIFRVGQWGTVCSDEWNTPDTEVVCRQLGYSKPVILGPVSFGPGKGPIWLDNVQCYGNETSLDRCQHNGWANHDCTHSKDVTVVCDINGGVTKPVRLSSYPNNTNGGLVEIYHAGAWGLICYDHWDLHDAHVACRQVGLAGVKAVAKETVDGLPRVHLGNVSCVGSEDTLASCPHSGWGVGTTCNYGYAGVVCTDSSASEGDVRLFGGRKPSEGRVEIFHLGEWGTVCEDGWTEQNARVVCYELGFTGVVSKYQSFGPGRGHIWLNNVQCSGIETSLVACGRSDWGQNPCSHTEDVGVICSDDAYVGCYKDSVPRVMSHKSPTLDVTPVKCIRYCQARGYQYSGLEWSTECYCGALYSKYGNASESECASPCAGDVTKICGGPYRLSVYVAQPVILPSSSPGYPPVRQSCSQIVPSRYTGYSMLLPMSMRNYFAGTHTSGYITSPNYPSDYPNNVQCVWVLNLQPGTEARITFVDFKTELKFDYVEIRDGKRSYSSLLTPYLGISGKNLRTRTYVASTNSMWIKFTSDSSIIDKGFKLNYYITSPTTTLSPVPPTSLPMSSLPNVQMVQGNCNGVTQYPGDTFGYLDFYHNRGYIQSPRYPNSYPNNMDCRWTIIVQAGFIVRITIAVFELAVNDFLHTSNVKSAQAAEGNKTYYSKDNFALVWFQSNGYGTAKGFYLTYEKVSQPLTKAPTTESNRHSRDNMGFSAGKTAGIALGVCIPIVIVIVVFVVQFLREKRKRHNQGVQHTFVNEAYDNDNMTMSEPSRQPTTATDNAPHALPAEPSVFYAAVAPPPYSAAMTTGVYFIPTNQNGSVATAPPYAHLYATPPPYQVTATPAPVATHAADTLGSTTSIGSVTTPTNTGSTAPFERANRLPPIRPGAGAQGMPTVDVTGDATKKVLPQQDEAGPLPNKVPLTTEFPPSDQPTPTQPSPVRTVSPTPRGLSFDTDVPFEFICPITNEIMKHPVSIADGYTYERRAIKSWLRRNSNSPMTNEPITDTTLRPNDHLRARIEEFVSTHSLV